MIAGGLASLCVDLLAGGRDHEDSTLLQRVTLHLGLPVASSVGAQTGREHAQGAHASHPALKRHGPEGAPPRVRQEANGVGIAAGELVEVRDGPTPDHHHAPAESTNRRLGLEYMSNLLTAEQSAEVADEDQDCGVVGPARGEVNGVPASVEDRDVGECVVVARTGLFVLSHGAPVVVHSVA